MAVAILPDSVAPFEPRRPPILVLDKQAELDTNREWLVSTLLRIGALRKPQPSTKRFWRQLSRQLHNRWKAHWDLCSLSLHLAPMDEAQNRYFSPETIHIQGYITYVDLVWGHTVGFKLAKHSIDSLVDYHRDVFCAHPAAKIPDNDMQDELIDCLNDKFIQAINELQLRFNELVLEGMGKRGTGELMQGRAADVSRRIQALFVPFDHADFLIPRSHEHPVDATLSDASTSWTDLSDTESYSGSEDDEQDAEPLPFDRVPTPTPPDCPPLAYPREDFVETARRLIANQYSVRGPVVFESIPSPSCFGDWPSQQSCEQE